jgi:hypothetical protein
MAADYLDAIFSRQSSLQLDDGVVASSHDLDNL